MKRSELKDFLNEKVLLYNHTDFIATDPIQIPHQFNDPADIEIAAFLIATIAWGNRKSIINNGNKLMDLMDHSPAEFIKNHQLKDLDRFDGFVHRTFNRGDLKTFIRALQKILVTHGTMENCFVQMLEKVEGAYENSAFAKAYLPKSPLQVAISLFKQEFFTVNHESRSQKHVSDPLKNSSAKRINMFLRWMVRKDNAGVDFGIWRQLDASLLSLPLDVHTGNIARKLKILKRKQNDARAVAELDAVLRKLDPTDPVKFDFALFGLGAFNDF
ncbi:MAG: TIGR02757 family protein [Nonlabens sp.]